MRVVKSGNFWIGIAVGAVVVPWAMQKFSAKKAAPAN
jgi:hypothetical protein